MAKDTVLIEKEPEYLHCHVCNGADFMEVSEVRLTSDGIIENTYKYRCLGCHKVYLYAPGDDGDILVESY